MSFRKLRMCIVAAGVIALGAGSAQASDWYVTANVSQVEVSYVPSGLLFKVDTAAGNCAANSTLSWNVKGSTAEQQNGNVQAAFALLLTARAAGRTISMIGNNSGCTIDYMYLN